MTEHKVGNWQGTALLLGGVLGPGMLVLPRLAAAAAGPAAVVAWGGLLVLSVPVALTFAALGSRYPGGGGVATFAGLAFGPRAAAIVGWWFYGAVPLGIVAGALAGGQYVAAALGLDTAGRDGMAAVGPGGGVVVVAGLLLLAAFAANAVGLRTSGRVQLVMVLMLVTLLVVAVALAAPHVSGERFTPFAPYGATGIAHAAGVLLFAFVGWEAASHLSGEFADRRHGLVRATRVTLGVVAVLYVAVAVVSTGTGAAGSQVPLTALLEEGIGPAARPITGVVATLLTFGAINTYIAGAARLGATLASDRGGLGRSLGLLAGLTGGLAVAVLVWPIDLDPLMRATSACLAAVTTAGTAAAVKALTGRGRALAIAGTILSCASLVFCGAYLLVPAGLAIGCWVRGNWSRAAAAGRTS